jgi:hypothetical protein
MYYLTLCLSQQPLRCCVPQSRKIDCDRNRPGYPVRERSSLVRLKELSAWHRFTYTQLYPAVLGSMLYDVLHVTEGWGPLQAVEISITLLYCVDFFYLQGDLGSDQLPQGNWRDTMLDAAIALVFGAAYWQASDRKLFNCYTLLAVVGALIVAYHFTPNRRSLWAILPHSVLTILFAYLAWLARGLDSVTWTFAAVSWFPTVWYGAYVFCLASRVLPSGK